MSQQRVVDALPDDVWAVLADGWLYPVFVVGAARMRAVDEAWPAAGAQLHHSAGVWPLVLDDTTSVTVCDRGRRLELTARGWPAGRARVTVELAPQPGGRTLVTMAEDASAGPGLAVPGPVRRAVIDRRNTETLQRLAWLVEGRAMAQRGGPGDHAG